MDLGERWTLLLAGRYDEVTRRNETSNPRANGTATFSEFQPKLQLSFAASDQLNLFATYAEGFRPGGFNTLANSPEVQFASRFESETLSNFELGAKFRSPGGNVTVNAAAFYIDYEGQQFFLFDPLGSQALINANESYIAGAELEFAWNLGSGWTLLGAYGFTESEIEDIDQAPGLNVPVADIIGREVPNAPVYSVNLAADYQRELGAYLFNGRLEFERRGTTWFTIDNLDFQEPYNLVNLRLGLSRGSWTLTGFVNNLFDEEWIDFYFSRKYIGLRTDIAWPSAKRMAGVELAWNF
jgi:iron complex outermembrane receptor protein